MTDNTPMVSLAAVAQEINAAHSAAIKHADLAIKYACKAGEMLLQVKSELKHGGFIPWVEANLTVSARQAQRYMRAARGEPMTPRSIKSDTMSYLTGPSWLPTDPATLCLAHFQDVRRVPQVTDDDTIEYDICHPVVWVQRTPPETLEPEAQETPYYDAVLIDGRRCWYSDIPLLDYQVFNFVLRRCDGLTPRNSPLPISVPPEASADKKISAVAGIGWEYHDNAGAGLALRWIEMMEAGIVARWKHHLEQAGSNHE